MPRFLESPPGGVQGYVAGDHLWKLLTFLNGSARIHLPREAPQPCENVVRICGNVAEHQFRTTRNCALQLIGRPEHRAGASTDATTLDATVPEAALLMDVSLEVAPCARRRRGPSCTNRDQFPALERSQRTPIEVVDGDWAFLLEEVPEKGFLRVAETTRNFDWTV